MTYALPVVHPKNESEVRSRALVVPSLHPTTVRGPAANEEASSPAEHGRPIDPMLLVYQERVETFRLIGAALRRGFASLTRTLAH